jgi:DNA-binding HxlR family transcriptional regulator
MQYQNQTSQSTRMLDSPGEPAEREAMTNQAYGQFCGLSRALEVVGEPWALLLVRDPCVGPKPFEELRQGLSLMSASVLSQRLQELYSAGVIRTQLSKGHGNPVYYELTEYGSELQDIVLALGRWGARTMGGPRREEVVTSDSIVMALRSTFRPETAAGLRIGYELRLGDIVVYARINDGKLEAGKGSLSGADLVIESGPVLKAVMAGEMSANEAMETGGIVLRSGDIRLSADPGLLAWFVEMFHIPPVPPSNGHGRIFGSVAAYHDDPLHPIPVANFG